jgi:two-component system sensor kinase FixL
VEVADTGPGMPEGITPEQLFEGFFTTTHTGMGIGLALSRSFVEDHGGSIHAEVNDSGGMTFRFTLRVDGGTDDE